VNQLSQPLNLIDRAIEESRKYRESFINGITGIIEPLTPDARIQTVYLRIRESLNRGCREAVKLLEISSQRSLAYSILMEATYNIFHYRKTPELMTYYNRILDETVGTH
jgi:hypothetical protein